LLGQQVDNIVENINAEFTPNVQATTSKIREHNKQQNEIKVAHSTPTTEHTEHTCEVAQIASNSFYRRPLPESLIAFSSVEGV
jgi:hypothetical protein